MVVRRAAQEAGMPHSEYINRKKENAIFTPTLGDFKKFTYSSKRNIVILLVILFVITIGFYDCLSNYNCLCCVVCCTGIVLLIDCYMTATKLQILLPLLLSSLLPAGSYTFNLFLPLCVWLWMQLATRLVLFNTCKHIVNMMVIMMSLVFTITKVIIK